MYTIKNSLKNIKRNSKRYILMGIIIALITFISIISLIFNSSAEETKEIYLNEYGSQATIEINPESLKVDIGEEPTAEDGGKIDFADMPESLTLEEFQKIAKSQYVQSVIYEQSSAVIANDISTVEEENFREITIGPDGEQVENSLSIIGTDDLENSTYFEDDTNVLVTGAYPTSENEILVSQDLFEENNLTLNDTISVSPSDDSDTNLNLTVVGVFEPIDGMSNLSNTIFSNYSTVENLSSDDTRSNVNATYTLTSYQDVDNFEQELYDNGLSETYYVDNNQELLDQILGPVESTMKILNGLMIFIIIIGGAILIFINLLILRDRKYEIGVMRALGASKANVISSFMIEVFIVSIISIMLAIIAGIALSQPVSNSIMSSVNNTSSDVPTQMSGPSGGPTDTKGVGKMNTFGGSSEIVSSIQTTVNLKVLLITTLLNLLLVLVTTFIATRVVIRSEPNEILRER